MKPLVIGAKHKLPFLSIFRDQRNSLNQTVGNQIPMKLNYQRYHLLKQGNQPKHTCLISGKARGTSQDGLVARYTFRRLLRFGTFPGIYKGK